jgi:hypothetical protein
MKGWIVMLMDKHWRVTQPELHKFARRISDLFPVGSRRDWLVTQLRDYKSAGERFVESEIKWRNDRREYFEEELPKQPASFRNENACDHESLMWDTYERLLDSQQDIDDVSTKLRRATCVRLWPDKSGHLVPTRMRCFTDYGDGTGSVNVVGWIPRDLFKFDDSHKPSSPLPPSKLKGGRGYTVPEICYGLAVIHDADGSFSPFAAEGSAIGDLFGFEFWFMEARIRGTEMAAWRAANDDWLVSLEPLFAQASSAIESQCPSGASPENAHQAHDKNLFPRGPLEDWELMAAIVAVNNGRGTCGYDIEILRKFTDESVGACPNAESLQKRIRRARQDGRTTLPPSKRGARCAR